MDNLDKAFRDTSGPLTKGLERNEDLLNLNPQNGLMQLALETGGTFIGDVNRIGPRLIEIDEDLHTYYLLSYVPTNENYDGRYRSISVRTKRSGVDLLARKGYSGGLAMRVVREALAAERELDALEAAFLDALDDDLADAARLGE